MALIIFSDGMRKHPVMAITKCTRNRLYSTNGNSNVASGDGVVKKQDGAVVVEIVLLSHNSTYQTVYAHMSKFASGVRSGVKSSKVKLLDL